jgi:hypothetical protein
MKSRFLVVVVLCVTFSLVVPIFATAQQSASPAAPPTAKPYRDGAVWEITFVRAKAGMGDRYMRYLAGDWKREQEALKKAGYVLDYKVIQTEPHGPQDFDVMLMTQYKDLASMEANADKAEALALQLFGGEQKVESGYQDRASYRDVLGSRLAREVILEPKTAGAK